MIDDMFHSAALKLTLWYLAIIMFLSIAFSGIIYNFSANQFAQRDDRQELFLNQRLVPINFKDWDQLRQQGIDTSLKHLRGNLVLFNLMVLVAGGCFSYYLARRTLQPIEDTLDAQKRFTGDASHELRTPLTAMQTENEVALRNPSLTKDQAVSLIRSNLEEVGKLKALSDGLLKLASIDQPTDHQAVSIKDVTSSAVSSWEKAAADKKIELRAELRDAKVRGDYSSLADLISILLDNAIKYSPRGSIINISSSVRDKTAQVSIKDQGPGIKASELPRIFDRFYRSDESRSKNTADGYGLGLAIAKKIAENHNGSLEVKSTLDKGSVFTVRLPSV